MKLNAATIRIMGAMAGIGLLNAAAWAAPHATETQAGAGNGNGSASAPVSVLQVTGTTNSFTVSAQHADVLSLLKLVFDQAHRQFVPDASVTGDVTFALTGQRFDVVLAAICRQTFLRYEVDKQGIYRFRRDEEALRNLLLKTQAINAVLQEQLRGMGYAVPASVLGTDSQARSRAMQGRQSAPAGDAIGGQGGFGGGGGGSFGGGFSNNAPAGAAGRGRSANSADGVPAPGAQSEAANTAKRVDSGKAGAINNADAQNDITRQSNNRARANGTQRALGANSPLGEAGPAGPIGQQATRGEGDAQASLNRDGQLSLRGQTAQDFDLGNTGQYQLFLKQNNLVSINTKNEKKPMQDILADLGKQAGVPILIDPDVPKGDDFVLSATIPARPLNEMLNILAYYARLEWRWVNGRIYITTTPQLQLYLRGALLPAPNGTGNIGGGITILPQRSAAPASQSPPKKAEEGEKPKKDQNN